MTWAARLGAAVIAAGAIAGAGMAFSRSGDNDRSDKKAETIAFTAVRSGQLTASVVARGDVVAQDPVAIGPPSSTPDGAVITLLPAPGAQVNDGDVLYEANDRPVFAIGGPIGLYRDLGFGDAGEDVLRFQQTLIQLGVLRGRANGTYGSSTAAAVAALYRSRGYEPPMPPPEISEQIRVLEQQRAELTRSNDPAATHDALVDLDRQIRDARTRLATPTRRAEFVALTSLPATVISAGRSLGDKVVGDGAILTVSSGQVVVEIPFLDPGFARFNGKPIELYLEPKSPDPVSAIVTGVATRDDESLLIASASELTPDHVGSNIRVVIVDRSAGETTLLVPITALISRPNGTSQVEARQADGSTTRVDVVVIDQAGGEVSIRPVDTDSLHDGDQVRIAPR